MRSKRRAKAKKRSPRFFRLAHAILAVFAFLCFLLYYSNKSHGTVDDYIECVIPKERSVAGYELSPDAGGAIRGIILQYKHSYIDGLPDAVRDDVYCAHIIGALDDDVRVGIVCTDKNSVEFLLKRLQERHVQSLASRLRIVVVNPPISIWARDPYTVLVKPQTGNFTLISAKGRAGTGLDRTLARTLMKDGIGFSFLRANTFTHPTLDLQGGSVTSDDKYVYIDRRAVEPCRIDNKSGTTVYTEIETKQQIETLYKKRLIVLDGFDVHNDRYHIPLGKINGRYTSLLADPVAALEILASLTPDEKRAFIDHFGKNLPEPFDSVIRVPDVTPEAIQEAKTSDIVKSLDRVQRTLENEGMKVIRIAALPELLNPAGPRFGLYYTNSIFNEARGRKYAIIPGFGIDRLDLMAKRQYESLGFEVKQIYSMGPALSFGAVRCLVQVLSVPVQHPPQ